MAEVHFIKEKGNEVVVDIGTQRFNISAASELKEEVDRIEIKSPGYKLEIRYSDVVTPATANLRELIDKLRTDFFFRNISGQVGTVSSLIIGDVPSGNYTEFESDGSMVAYGEATMWDDLNVNINSLPVVGARSPERVIVTNDGTGTTGVAIEFNGVDANCTVPYFSGMDTADLTIAMWVNADTNTTNELLDRDTTGGFEFYMNNGSLIFSPAGGTTVSAPGLLTGANQFLVATVKQEGTNIRCKIYIDGVAKAEQVISGSLYQGNAGYIIGEWHNGGWNYDGRMENLQVFNKVLTDAQISELYNNGTGTNALPTGISIITDVIIYFSDSDVNDSQMTGATNCVNNGASFIEGFIGVISGSIGVTSLMFSNEVVNEIFFTAQLPHKYKEYTDIEPHIHFSKKSANTGNIYIGLEFLWVNVNEYGGVTTLVGSAIPVGEQGQHKAINVAVLDGSTKKISSVIQGRLFRDPNNPLDTFPDEIYIGDFDFHFEINTQGSRSVWTK